MAHHIIGHGLLQTFDRVWEGEQDMVTLLTSCPDTMTVRVYQSLSQYNEVTVADLRAWLEQRERQAAATVIPA